MAIVKDSDGGEFMVWQGKKHFGTPHLEDTDLVNIPGFPIWFELNTRDLNKAINFYEKVFGWEHVTNTESNYTIFFKGDEQVGGVNIMSDEWPKETPSNWMTYFQVNDIEGSEKLVKELGGNALSRSNKGMIERTSTVSDPTGITFQLTRNANLQELRKFRKIQNEGEKKLGEDRSLKRKLSQENLNVDGNKGEQPETKKRKIS